MMRRGVWVLVSAVLWCGAVAVVGAEEWVIFEPLEVRSANVDGREQNLRVYGAAIDGRQWTLILLQGGRLVDPQRDDVLVVSGPALRSERGTMKVDLSAVESVSASSFTLVERGSGSELRMQWAKRKLTVVFENPAGATSTPSAAVVPASGTDDGLEFVPEFTALAHGVKVRAAEGETAPELTVETVAATPAAIGGMLPVGQFVQISADEATTIRHPVEIFLPVPEEYLEKPGNLVVVRRDEEAMALLAPHRIDQEGGGVVVRTREFSTWGVYTWEVSYPSALVSGVLTVVPGCDEDPDWGEVHLECSQTVSGESGSFPIPTDGIGPYQVFPPIPTWLFGTYQFKYVFGMSDNYLFSAGQPLPSVAVTEAGANSRQDFELYPTSSRMKGTVTDGDGNPLDRVKVAVIGDGLRFTGRTHGDGAYEVDWIGNWEPGGPRTLRFSRSLTNLDRPECGDLWGEVELEACVTNQRNFVWKPVGEITGVVTDKDGEVLSDVRIQVVAADGETQNTLTGPGGDYSVFDVVEGEASVTATCPEDEDSETSTVEVECNDTSTSNFQLDCCTGELFGTVTDDDGKGVSGASVVAKDADGEVFETSTDGSGAYQLEGLAGGLASVTATCPENQDESTLSVDIPCNEAAQLDFQIECCTGDVVVNVYDGEFPAEDGMTVTLRAHDGSTQTKLTEVGGVVFEKVPPGPAEVSVTCPDVQDSDSGQTEVVCDEAQYGDLAVDCSEGGLHGTIEVQRGLPGVMEAKIDGGFDVTLTVDDNVSGIGTAVMTIDVVGDGGRCSGRQNLALSISGSKVGKELRLDIEFDAGGRSMSWECGGGRPVGIDAIAGLEDEGRNLKITIDSNDPFHASLTREAGQVPFGTRLEVEISGN